MTPMANWIHGLASGDFVVVTEAGFALMIFPPRFLTQTCLGDAERRAVGCAQFRRSHLRAARHLIGRKQSVHDATRRPFAVSAGCGVKSVAA
jgi:hypothetical protein